MASLIIGTTFLYDYNEKGKGRLIIVATQQEISRDEESARRKVKDDLQNTLLPYLSNIQFSEEEKRQFENEVIDDILYDLKERAPNQSEEELRTILTSLEFQIQIQEAVKDKMQNERSEIISKLMILPEKYAHLHRVDLKPDLLFGNRTYNAQIQSSLSRYVEEIKNVIVELVRFNKDPNKPKSKLAMNAAIADEFANLTEVVFICPCNLGYPHEKNQNALILREPKTMHTIMKALRENKNNELLVKCLWTTNNTWTQEDKTTLEKAKEVFEASERLPSSSTLQTSAYHSENHFYPPHQIETVLSNLSQWWKEGLVKELQTEKNTSDTLNQSAQGRFAKLKERAKNAIGLGSAKIGVYSEKDDLDKNITDDATAFVSASSEAPSVQKKQNRVIPTADESDENFTHLP